MFIKKNQKIYRNCSKYITLSERLLKSPPSVAVLWCQLAIPWCICKEADVICIIQHITLAELWLFEDFLWKKIHSSGNKFSSSSLPPSFHCFSSFPCWPNYFPLVSFKLSLNLWAYGFPTVILCWIWKLNMSYENTASWERYWLTLQG